MAVVWGSSCVSLRCVFVLLPGGEAGSVLLLSRSVNVQNWKVPSHFLHVLVVKQGVETRFIWTNKQTNKHTRDSELLPAVWNVSCLFTNGSVRCRGRWGWWVGWPWRRPSWWRAARRAPSPHRAPEKHQQMKTVLIKLTTTGPTTSRVNTISVWLIGLHSVNNNSVNNNTPCKLGLQRLIHSSTNNRQ